MLRITNIHASIQGKFPDWRLTSVAFRLVVVSAETTTETWFIQFYLPFRIARACQKRPKRKSRGRREGRIKLLVVAPVAVKALETYMALTIMYRVCSWMFSPRASPYLLNVENLLALLLTLNLTMGPIFETL